MTKAPVFHPGTSVMLLAIACAAGAGTAHGQITGSPFGCHAHSSVPSYLRAEGYSEQIGDITLNCTGGQPTAFGNAIPQATIKIFLNTNVTGRILSNGGSEALLLIDEPGSAENPLRQLCESLSGCVVAGTGGVGEPFNGTSARPNIYQGVVSGNTVTFQGIPIDPPRPGRGRTFRLTNIKANATTVTSGSPPQVTAAISISPSAAVPIDQSLLPVGFVSRGLNFSSGLFTIPGCTGIDASNWFALVSFSEGFGNAFKTRTALGPLSAPPQDTPGAFPFNTESGFGFGGLPGAGLADSGTRLKATFRNIPPGVDLWISVSSAGTLLRSAAVLIPSETGTFSRVAGTATFHVIDAVSSAPLGFDVVRLPVVDGSATAVWEVTDSDPFVVDTFDFGVFVTSSTSGPVSIPAESMSVKGGFAPAPPGIPLTGAAQAQGSPFPLARFADTSRASDMMIVTTCVTRLLFPFVTTLATMDTGLAISNTSKDPLGTTPGSGRCRLEFFGFNSPGPVLSPEIDAGTTYTTVISSLAPRFQGYLFAVCNFRFAHGFAVLTSVGAPEPAMSYLALVLPSRSSLRDAPGESLLH